jgi:hypothetical protein
MDESSDAEYSSPLDAEYISRVIAAEWPRSVSWGSISVDGLALRFAFKYTHQIEITEIDERRRCQASNVHSPDFHCTIITTGGNG